MPKFKLLFYGEFWVFKNSKEMYFFYLNFYFENIFYFERGNQRLTGNQTLKQVPLLIWLSTSITPFIFSTME